MRIVEGANFTASRSERISSMPRLLAASISRTSSAVPAIMARQFSHVLSGVAVGPFTQSMHRARIFAAEVLPEPRGPENRYAWASLPVSMALVRVRTTASCPTKSAKVLGRQVRYRDSPFSTFYSFAVPAIGYTVNTALLCHYLRSGDVVRANKK